MSSVTYPDISILSFKDKLKVLEQELTDIEKFSKDDIMTASINQRLCELLKRYHEEVDINATYLLQKASAKVLKELTRINRQDDIDVIEQYFIDDTDLDEE